MPRNMDQRKYETTRGFDPKAAQRKTCKKLSKNHNVEIGRVNKFLGGAEQVQSIYTGSQTSHLNNKERRELKLNKELSDATFIGLALKHLQSISSTLGFDPSEKPEFVPDPFVKKTRTGDRIVNVQQYFRGIPVFQMERVVILNQYGAIKYVDGRSIALSPDLDILPRVVLKWAILAAGRYLVSSNGEQVPAVLEQLQSQKIDLEGYEPKVLCRFALSSQPTLLDQKPFGEVIPAHLVFFYEGPQVRLGWHLTISTEDMIDQYLVIVEADSQTKDLKNPEVLFWLSTTSSMPVAQGNVWTHNPGENAGRQMQDFPVPKGHYPIELLLSLPDGFPRDWIKGNSDIANGNNVLLTPSPARGVLQQDNLIFDPPQEQGNEQRALNAFYFCNLMHDFFFLLGFNESTNFQEINATEAGEAGDPLEVIIDPDLRAFLGKTFASVDGMRTTIRLCRGASLPNEPSRHTALDAEVVFHEFTHAVTSRMVGKNSSNNPFQSIESKGLSEGWSDYFALTFINYNLDPELTKIMGWVSDKKLTGLRNHPYDDNFPSNIGAQVNGPNGAFSKVGLPPHNTEHPIGEIWCAALMKMNRDLGTRFGNKKKGHRIGWQIVFNSLEKLNMSPTFPQACQAMKATVDDVIQLPPEDLARLNDELSQLPPEDLEKVKQVVHDTFKFFGG